MGSSEGFVLIHHLAVPTVRACGRISAAGSRKDQPRRGQQQRRGDHGEIDAIHWTLTENR
jgi:hypothetical protein